MRETRSTCCYCGVGCGVIIASDGLETDIKRFDQVLKDTMKISEIVYGAVERPDIVIVEGLNVLQPAKLPKDGQANLEATIHRALELGIHHIETARDLMADAATEIEALRDQNHVYHAEIGRLKDMIELLYKASK